MSLKSELQAIDAEQLEHVTRAYFDRMTDLIDQDRETEELLTSMQRYPSLNKFLGSIVKISAEDGHSEEEVVLISLGASALIAGLCELADIQELPPAN